MTAGGALSSMPGSLLESACAHASARTRELEHEQLQAYVSMLPVATCAHEQRSRLASRDSSVRRPGRSPGPRPIPVSLCECLTQFTMV